MKIAFLIRSLNVGGTERQLVNLAAGLHAHGHDVSAISFYGGGVLARDLANRGVAVVPVEKSGRWDVLHFGRSLRKVLISLQPAVIYSLLPVPNIIAGCVRRTISPRPGLVWGIRAACLDPSLYDRTTRLTYVVERRLSFLPDAIVGNSSAALEEWRSVRTIDVIPNGIDVIRFTINREAGSALRKTTGIAADVPLIGRVGRLDPMKDYRTFLEAAALISAANRRARFMIVGSGHEPYEREMKTAADQLGLAESIVWIHECNDMPAVYNALDVHVSSSSTGEGFPNAVAEAMACGIPSVATDVGDSRKIVGDDALVVPPRDPANLAAAIERTLQADRSLLADRLRSRIVTRFSSDAMIDQTENLLLQVASGGISTKRGIRAH